jgi:hypothetical protein
MNIRHMMQVARAIGKEDYQRVENICLSTLERDPCDLFALLTLADHHWRDDRSDEALHYALRVLDVAPKDFTALRIAASVFYERNEIARTYECAKRLLHAELPTEPSVKFLHRALAPLAWIPKIKTMRTHIDREDHSNAGWLDWAKSCVEWYESGGSEQIVGE